MSKYDRLGSYLRAQDKDCVPITFDEIERVVGFKLPKSQGHQAWWSNSTSNNIMTRVWLDAGYRTEQVDMIGRKLVFRRVAPAARTIGMNEEQRMFKSEFAQVKKPVDRHPASGSMKGTFTIEPGYDLTQPAFDLDEIEEWEAKLDRIADERDARLSAKK